MRLIFLDVDGVLNNVETISKAETRRLTDMLDAACVARLNKICESAPDAKVILSSAWRVAFGMEETHLAMVKMGYTGPEIQDETPHWVRPRDPVFGNDRSQEIATWIHQNKEKLNQAGWKGDMVILDDATIQGPFAPWHVQSSYAVGLTDALVEDAIHVLHHGPLGNSV